MIEQILNRQFILEQLQAVSSSIATGNLSEAQSRALVEELGKLLKTETENTSGQATFDVESERRGSDTPVLDDVSFFSRDPVVSNFQSALEEYFETQVPDALQTQGGTGQRRGGNADDPVTDVSLANAPRQPQQDGRRLFNRFSITDPGWIQSKLSEGLTLLRRKHPFRDEPAPPFTIADNARLLVVGDWGSGLPRAQSVATVMRGVLDESAAANIEQHVVHLGDVYYSGWKREYEKRFLPYWPVRQGEASRITSWALNSNHDMYSGGHGFYDTLLSDPRFALQRQSSFFSLVNAHWRILGLDTAWETERLHGSQPRWLEEQVDEAHRAGQKVMLLSHHPMFSAYDHPSPKLEQDVAPVLADGGVDVWLWGHEHRLMTYQAHEYVRHARCIGHGGVPVYMWRGDNDALPTPADYEYRERFRHGIEYWAVMGFAVLELDGPTISVRYVNEFGTTHHEEQIT
jgi:hypothetical protein